MKSVTGVLMLIAIVVLPLANLDAQANPGAKISATLFRGDYALLSHIRGALENQASLVGTEKLEFTCFDAKGDANLQDDFVNQALASGTTALVLNLVDPGTASRIFEKAKAKHTPIVFFNREPNPNDLMRYDLAYYVGTRSEQGGVAQGQIVADYWKAHPEADKNHDGVLQYVSLVGDPENQDSKARSGESVNTLNSAGIDTQALGQETAQWDRQVAKEKMRNWLAQFGDTIEVVFSNNDDMALGAIDALSEAGYFSGTKKIVVVGFDATPAALDAIKDGTLLATVLNDAISFGKATFEISYTLAQGKAPFTSVAPLSNIDGTENPFGRYVWVPYVKITKDNVNLYRP